MFDATYLCSINTIVEVLCATREDKSQLKCKINDSALFYWI